MHQVLTQNKIFWIDKDNFKTQWSKTLRLKGTNFFHLLNLKLTSYHNWSVRIDSMKVLMISWIAWIISPCSRRRHIFNKLKGQRISNVDFIPKLMRYLKLYKDHWSHMHANVILFLNSSILCRISIKRVGKL